MGMFDFRPNLVNETQVSANPLGALQQTNQALSGIGDVLKSAQAKRMIRENNEAKFISNSLDRESKKENLMLNQSNKLQQMILKSELDEKAAISKFGRDSKVSAELSKSKRLLSDNKLRNDIVLESSKHKNNLIRDELKNIEARKVAKIKSETDIALANIKNIGNSRISQSDKNNLVKEIDSAGGIDSMILQTAKDIESDNIFFDFELSDQSRQDLKATITNALLEDPNEVLKFRLNRKEYIREFMREHGTTDESFFPFGKDTWVPNETSILLKQKLKDIERLRSR